MANYIANMIATGRNVKSLKVNKTLLLLADKQITNSSFLPGGPN